MSASTGIPHCEGTEVTTVTDPESNLEEAAIPMTDKFVCTLTIKVMNHGHREVTLHQVTVPVSGPGAGSSFQVTHIGDVAVLGNDEVDAVSEISSSLEPGAEELLDLRVAFRESGCTSEGASQWVAPTIEVNDLLASHDLTIADLPRFLGTAASSCDT
ncbi:hypothetical protein [Knoellia locipacati]|uniref:hypothetical protein n=1 Tax=Knoellia locipacati TaxID=882824 RepID=UPI0011BF2151